MSHVINILILDDEETLLDFYPFILKKYLSARFWFITIKDGDYDLRIIKDSNIMFDLIITDIMHQGKSCFDLIEFIKKKFPQTEILITSATSCMFGNEKLSIADAYLPKPVKINEFLNIVSSLLGIYSHNFK